MIGAGYGTSTVLFASRMQVERHRNAENTLALWSSCQSLTITIFVHCMVETSVLSIDNIFVNEPARASPLAVMLPSGQCQGGFRLYQWHKQIGAWPEHFSRTPRHPPKWVSLTHCTSIAKVRNMFWLQSKLLKRSLCKGSISEQATSKQATSKLGLCTCGKFIKQRTSISDRFGLVPPTCAQGVLTVHRHTPTSTGGLRDTLQHPLHKN